MTARNSLGECSQIFCVLLFFVYVRTHFNRKEQSSQFVLIFRVRGSAKAMSRLSHRVDFDFVNSYRTDKESKQGSIYLWTEISFRLLSLRFTLRSTVTSREVKYCSMFMHCNFYFQYGLVQDVQGLTCSCRFNIRI